MSSAYQEPYSTYMTHEIHASMDPWMIMRSMDMDGYVCAISLLMIIWMDGWMDGWMDHRL